MIQIGDNIKLARKRKGFTQEELATQIGVTSQAVSRWESGAGMPDISMIVPIAQVLSVSTDMLFGLENASNDNQLFIEITNKLLELENNAAYPAQAALAKCNYLEEELNKNLGSFVIATCLVERIAELSRYTKSQHIQFDWNAKRTKAITVATQIIRFCNQKEWLERTHFALSWIYIHEKDFASAREHIAQLPSARENRLQESLLAQVASQEHGIDSMKSILQNNLQNFVRVINKEILYAMEDMSCHDSPENAVAFGTWGLQLIAHFCKKKELIPYCRGFFRDIYKFLLRADLRMQDYEAAGKHWHELCDGMQLHYNYYQEILADEALIPQYDSRQINYMRGYTEDFIAEKQQFIKDRLKEWHGEECFEEFLKHI